MDDRYTIDTPENIEFAYDIAGIGSRFLAAIIDTLLIGIAELLVAFLIGVLISAVQVEDRISAAGSILAALGSLLAFAILWGYYLIFELVWNGQSPGKRVIGLRVVREGGHPVTFVSSAIRNLVRAIDFLPAFYGIGVIVMFVDRRARRLGDLAAGTLVVKEQRAVTLESLTAPGAEVALPSAGAPDRQPTLPNVHLIDERDYHLIQEFLRRRDELGPDARSRLAGQLASGLQERLGVPRGSDAERFLQYVAAEYRLFKRQEQG